MHVFHCSATQPHLEEGIGLGVTHILFYSCLFQKHPQREDYWGHVNPIGPRACYDEGKRVAETMCYAYAKQVHGEVLITCSRTIRKIPRDVELYGVNTSFMPNRYSAKF